MDSYWLPPVSSNSLPVKTKPRSNTIQLSTFNNPTRQKKVVPLVSKTESKFFHSSSATVLEKKTITQSETKVNPSTRRPLPSLPPNYSQQPIGIAKKTNNQQTSSDEINLRVLSVKQPNDLPNQLEFMLSKQRTILGIDDKRKKPIKTSKMAKTLKPINSSEHTQTSEIPYEESRLAKRKVSVLSDQEKKAISLLANGISGLGKSGIHGNNNDIVEREYLCINQSTKPILISKDMMNVEDTVEIRNFLQISELALHQMNGEVLPYNYIEAETSCGGLTQPVILTINTSFSQYKISFKCMTNLKWVEIKKMIEKGINTKASTRLPIKISNHKLVIAGTRLYFQEQKEMREYSIINDISRREKIINIELINQIQFKEEINQIQLKHQNLLLKEKKKCKASNFSDEILSFTIYELLNFDPEIVFKKFFDESEITNCIKNYFETRSFEKYKIILKVSCCLYMGTDKLCNKEYFTSDVINTIFDCKIMTDFSYSMLPLETRLGITLYAIRKGKKVVIGFVNTPLFDFQNFLLSGYVNLKLWPDEESDAVSSPLQNPSSTAPIISIKFPDPVIKIFYQPYEAKYPQIPKNLLKISNDVQQLALHNDPFQPLTNEQKNEIWQNRFNILIQFPDSIDLLLRAVPWTDYKAREEMADLIKIWPGISPIQVIGLLDVRNSFTPARDYAVRLLEETNDKVILGYLPQFIQVLKFESYTCSSLALFLLKRALKNRGDMGQLFYWLLVGENEKTKISLRSKILLEVYNSMCGIQLKELKTQENFIKIIEETAVNAKHWKDDEVKTNLPNMLTVVNNALEGSRLTLPFTSRETVSCVVINKCKVFDSNAHPILLCFQSSPIFSQQETRFIFKVGDNLMQDMLTLQMFKLMDDLWKKNGIDFRMTIYNVLATSTTSGIIQFVPNCETVNSIQTKGRGITGVFDDACIYEWIKSKNLEEEDLKNAIENFTYSCAGYCVATYVIGVGDRHNDNIMVSKDGHLFHIDFGHFLGNIIKLGFYNKESAPFVLTNDFMFVITMGNTDTDNYSFFENICTKGFMILRNNAKTFIYSFMMMLCSGVPQLKHVEDVQYLKDAFMLDKTDDEAEQEFRSLISQSLGTFRTRLNFFMHSMVH
ncbi:phosphatidylinositol 3-kinase catalytic subunit gamma, putative [Entamoeba dispar SAW760]|uniref:Phosphatidylinositol 3-kinase catalytic subunit gamma, putative n=1 Tax=Entamoeba dispar (strain ATCC PRA-260 / SAW760) TaxID=370354 RepID=B0E5N8_ENTDS|nr:phosphatidylinositol 3-kinase catalytic subunit gamma, putative [Entamoeba dispar SAW760]EDR30134.1 phosphatidylinositol 3-kinase catalytic subunit gamma, putative [Entamoeba dispar SAW760]|eukprot:EDR30134.1 phosphatidylinositol 3-kinase catalytic subunit gamma, putative [Entamoeba dispar SAW760]